MIQQKKGNYYMKKSNLCQQDKFKAKVRNWMSQCQQDQFKAKVRNWMISSKVESNLRKNEYFRISQKTKRECILDSSKTS